MIEVIALLGVIVFVGTVLVWLEVAPRNRARYSGRVYDPQRPVIRRAGAVGYTGQKCPLCGVTTFGNSPRCGACGRLNIAPRQIATESTKRRSLVEQR